MSVPIHVKVFEAKGLKAADRGGKSDPYYTISINGVKPFQTSKTIKGTVDPVWNETHVLNVKDKDIDTGKILIGLSDWDRIGAHDLLGFIRIDIKDLKHGEPIDKWYNCEGKKPGTKEKGKVHIVCHFNPKGVPFEKSKQVQQQPMMMNQQQPMMMNQQPMMMNQQPMMMDSNQ
ncbi:c2 domain-containing protein [Anaeramoeba ignava]|uniref:C2 domain-containing protein n=1 Tax=Anaeramoeba ignava TaxID=1746090 RepID=A0A9Q0LE62_ANAIG|nr:c2 domain-containing protein [Anaeramoeba ignava]